MEELDTCEGWGMGWMNYEIDCMLYCFFTFGLPAFTSR